MDNLIISGARQHNLKNISLTIPKNKLVVFSGVSGSGKSSLAFDTIYAEGQRRYVESLSSYARQFLGIMDKPDVDSIVGLSPAISIDQKVRSHNPRSTVGTVTEIYDYLRLLFARIGNPHCPNCGSEVKKQSPEQIVTSIIITVEKILKEKTKKTVRFFIMSPVVRDRKGEFSTFMGNLRSKGYRQVRIDGLVKSTDEDIVLIKTNKHSIDAIIDRITIDLPSLRHEEGMQSMKSRITDAVEQALLLSSGLVTIGYIEDAGFTMPDSPKKITDVVFSQQFACPNCGLSISEIEPRTFSFNSPHGACPTCGGIGSIQMIDESRIIKSSLTISEGGIVPFSAMFEHDTWFSRIVGTVITKHGFDSRTKLGDLNQKQLEILLHGTGSEVYEVHGNNRQGHPTVIYEEFPGIIGELKRRYKETSSEYIRAEIEKFMIKTICADCKGKRLKKESLSVTILDKSIADVTSYSISHCITFIESITKNPISVSDLTIATPITREIILRLLFLKNVGLHYLTLDRSAESLSGGEAQRIRLASQVGSGLSGVLYVLDEPSIGLHQRDNRKLIDTLLRLRDLGNTVIVVEHDKETIESADYIVDFGPKAGTHGGEIIAKGTITDIKNNPSSITGLYLSHKRHIKRQHIETSQTIKKLSLHGSTMHNLKNLTIDIPLGRLVSITGVSGSGKSTLIVDTLYKALFKHFNPMTREVPGAYTSLEGLEHIKNVVLIDQSPIGRTPRSNPATYTGVYSYVRDVFSMTADAKMRGYGPGRFSFNVRGGRCEACEGEGQKKIEMQFLSDVYVTCEVCHGTRFNSETLDILYHGKNISEILNMTVEESVGFFTSHPALRDKLKTMAEVGLEYIHLGQPAPTLSGGEAQRVKLAKELSRKGTGNTVYILDEPTTGLHFADLEKLLHVLHELVKRGNTVIVIEHNLDIIHNSDWIIDLGPEGGDEGGKIIASGSPQTIANIKDSYTGNYLKMYKP
jgi:excinuclease ABC subunit A